MRFQLQKIAEGTIFFVFVLKKAFFAFRTEEKHPEGLTLASLGAYNL